jgi:hypothetical protein
MRLQLPLKFVMRLRRLRNASPLFSSKHYPSTWRIKFGAGAVKKIGRRIHIALRLRFHQNDADLCGSGSATMASITSLIPLKEVENNFSAQVNAES